MKKPQVTEANYMLETNIIITILTTTAAIIIILTNTVIIIIIIIIFFIQTRIFDISDLFLKLHFLIRQLLLVIGRCFLW